MDKIIFGDNQFFGINHMSLSKAENQARRFGTAEEKYQLLRYVNSIGIKSFMFTTHAELEPVFDLMKEDPDFSDFKLIPCIPYGHKYANAITELGFFRAIAKFIPGSKLSAGCRVGISILTASPSSAMRMLVDSEMELLAGNNVEAVFLQNLATDLMIGLGMEYVLADFAKHVEKRHGVKVGFITMNHARLYDVLRNKLGIKEPLICSSINKIGFRMNPGKEYVEKCVRSAEGSTVAMGILASGAVTPRDAVEYVSKLGGVSSVLFGASTEEHIAQTKHLVDAHFAR